MVVLLATLVGPGAGVSSAAAVAAGDFRITYVGVPARAHAAIEQAARIWSGMLAIRVPVEVTVAWKPMGPGQLGHMGPKAVLVDNRFFVPTPLANTKAARDLLPGPDITGALNSQASWYYGTDGRTPSGRADLVSTVMHELGHGLGIVSTMTKDNVTGVGKRSVPSWIYDVHPATAGGRRLVRIATPSKALGRQLTSGRLYWAGRKGTAYNGGVRPRLYAPATFVQGTSYMHLDERTYRSRRNRLMTPTSWAGESTHVPGPIGLGMLRDMGWPLGPRGKAIVDRLTLATLASSTTSIPPGGSFTLTGRLRKAEGGAAMAGKTVKLYQRRIGSKRWRFLGSRTTSNRGLASFRLSRRVGMQFQLRHSRTTTTDADVSPIRTVRVR